MRRCAYCHRVIVAFGSGEQGEFCSEKCRTSYTKLQEGFCKACLAETTDEPPGRIYSVNGVGTMLMGTRWNPKGTHPCPNCGSVIQKKWFTFGFDVKALGTYRILYLRRGLMERQFLGRRLRNDQTTSGTAATC